MGRAQAPQLEAVMHPIKNSGIPLIGELMLNETN
jgi:hypothetical protein